MINAPRVNPLDFVGYPVDDIPRLLINAIPLERIEDKLKEVNFAYLAAAVIESTSKVLESPMMMLILRLGEQKEAPPASDLKEIPGIVDILRKALVDGKLPPAPIPEVDQICFATVKQFGLFETITAFNEEMGKL